MIKERAILLLLLIATGCSPYLDDPEQNNSFPVEDVFHTADELDAALTGLYDALQSGHLYGKNLVVFPDLMGGNVVYFGSGYFGLEQYSALDLQATDWYAEQTWVQAYKAINQANAILNALPSVAASDAGLTTARALTLKGESLFLRSVLYFDLIRLFARPYDDTNKGGPGVPFMDQPVLDATAIRYPERTSVDSVYHFITRDLEQALELLPVSTAPGRAGRYAALAWLARIAFQQSDYERAATYTEEILNGPFFLAAIPQDLVNREISNQEIIFTLLYQDFEPGGEELKNVYRTSRLQDDLLRNGYDRVLTTSQKAAIQADSLTFIDLRSDPGIMTPYPFIAADSSRCNKYQDNVSGFERSLDLPMARLAEFMLMRAEALAHTHGVNDESVLLLNQVRQRAIRIIDANQQEVSNSASYFEFENTDFPDAGALIEAIILERRVELAFEGNYLHDLLRLKRDVQGIPYSNCRLQLPIPQREIDANPNLVQQDGPCY